MSSLRWSIHDYNGMLTELRERIGPSHLTNPRDADVIVVWQDVLGSYGDLIKAMRAVGINKPVYVVQHGRAATLDYDKPNSFPLSADKFLCWGQSDFDRMARLGYADRVSIIGCPLNNQIKPKVAHDEKVVLFVPVNTGKEEPENIAVYYELLKHKYHKAQIKVLDNRINLKNKWDTTFNKVSEDFDVVAKLLPWHDKPMYHGRVINGYQDHPSNNFTVFSLLRNVDMVVGLDEGTTEIFAYGHNVPVVTVDGFKYRQHKSDGRKYEEMDIYRTKASTHVDLKDLAVAVEDGLAHPKYLEVERKEVAEAELGISHGDPIANLIKIVKSDFK